MAESVLVYRLGSLGDFVVALPALHLIERAFPNARRSLLTNVPVAGKAAAARDVLGESGLIHDFVEYPVRLRDPQALAGLRRRIRALTPEVVVHLTVPRGRAQSWRDAIFFALCGVRRQIGLPIAKSLLEYRWRETDGRHEHESERLARCVAELGSAALDRRENWDLRLTPAEERRAGDVLAAARIDPPFIACSIGTKFSTNDWGVENWRGALRRISARHPTLGLVLLGAEGEREASEIAAGGWTTASGNLCGLLAPRESAAVLRRAIAFVGHDSGPIHLAAAMGLRCVGVYSARHVPGPWFPHGANHKIIYHRTECHGCELSVCTRFAKQCITSITPDEVAEATAQLLAEGRAAVD